MGTTEETETKFAAWIKGYGVSKLVAEMRKRGAYIAITHSAAYQWLRQEHEPRPKKQRALVEISGGAITLDDIAAHFAPHSESQIDHVNR